MRRHDCRDGPDATDFRAGTPSRLPDRFRGNARRDDRGDLERSFKVRPIFFSGGHKDVSRHDILAELCDTRTYAHREGLRTSPGETLRSREENVLGCARENTPFTNGQQLGAEVLGRPSISIIRARNSQIYAT